MELYGGLRVVVNGDDGASNNEFGIDEGMVGGKQLWCDGMVNATLLTWVQEGLSGKDIIKPRFALA